MECQLFTLLLSWLVPLGQRHPRGHKQFTDTVIVAVLLWASLHDRPVFWACQEINWPANRRWLLQLPSPATMSRRLRSYQVLLLLEQLASFLRDLAPRHLLKIIDTKPITVGASTKDKDARRGYAAGEMAKGYKLCALLDAGGAIDAWSLQPLNTGDSSAALRLVEQTPGTGYIVADSRHDSNRLYQAAGISGWQLLAPRQKRDAVSHGRRVQSPYRLRALALLHNPLWVCGQPSSFGQDLLSGRDCIERKFGFLGNFGGGLAPLPNWVRTPHRIAVWIHAKLLIAAARDLQQQKHLHAK
jgi:hypothetical protein